MCSKLPLLKKITTQTLDWFATVLLVSSPAVKRKMLITLHSVWCPKLHLSLVQYNHTHLHNKIRSRMWPQRSSTIKSDDRYPRHQRSPHKNSRHKLPLKKSTQTTNSPRQSKMSKWKSNPRSTNRPAQLGICPTRRMMMNRMQACTKRSRWEASIVSRTSYPFQAISATFSTCFSSWKRTLIY